MKPYINLSVNLLGEMSKFLGELTKTKYYVSGVVAKLYF